MRLSNPPEGQLYGGISDIAFTGTREGLTKEQRRSLRWLIRQMDAERFHHGDCMGADAEAAKVASASGCAVLKYPSTSKTRAYSPIGKCVQEPKDPLERNKDIVLAGDCLIACPRGMEEERRSGTWAAVRYARGQDYLIWYVWPDGSLTGPQDDWQPST